MSRLPFTSRSAQVENKGEPLNDPSFALSANCPEKLDQVYKISNLIN